MKLIQLRSDDGLVALLNDQSGSRGSTVLVAPRNSIRLPWNASQRCGERFANVFAPSFVQTQQGATFSRTIHTLNESEGLVAHLGFIVLWGKPSTETAMCCNVQHALYQMALFLLLEANRGGA